MTKPTNVLILDATSGAEPAWEAFASAALAAPFRLFFASHLAEACETAASTTIDCALVDSELVDVSGLRALDPIGETSVVMLFERRDQASLIKTMDDRVEGILSRDSLDGADAALTLRRSVERTSLKRLLLSQRQELERVKEAGAVDDITELPTRDQFRLRLASALERTGEKAPHGVVLVGVDGLKAINGSFGHDWTDELLRQVSRRLCHCVRAADRIARWGDDEFALLIEDMARHDDALIVAQRILYALSRPFRQHGQDLYLSASIGIAFAPTDGEDAETLLRHADATMYRVKAAGGNGYQLYAEGLDVSLTQKITTESALRGALEREEFFLVFQPQLDVITGTTVGVEALLRWNDPERGVISPAEFVPALEDTGLISPVGEWVLRKACTQARAWQFAGIPNLRVSVNLSPIQFRQRGLVDRIQRILAETGLPPGSLEIELTESALMEDEGYASEVLIELQKTGSLIALDDFGTGYSSLAFLKNFPVDTLKIDRAFVRDIADNESDRTIFAAIVALGRALELRVLAEGVETREQLKILQEQGCHLIQGYLYARPMPADDVLAWLTTEPGETIETVSAS